MSQEEEEEAVAQVKEASLLTGWSENKLCTQKSLFFLFHNFSVTACGVTREIVLSGISLDDQCCGLSHKCQCCLSDGS